MSDVTSDYKKQEKRTRICDNIRNGIVYLFLCLWALIVLFPFCLLYTSDAADEEDGTDLRKKLRLL